jgi:UDP-2-acetamido-2,6-beta-L-arabino-hexul-4-ose reductase
MLSIGITGVDGFIGKNLSLALEKEARLFRLVQFNRNYFRDIALLSRFVSQCDVIVHLAALSRHPAVGFVFENNVGITKQLISAMQVSNVKPYIIFASSIHDNTDTEYARGKRVEYALLSKWAQENNSNFSCLVLNNIYGPYCKPNYASFVATFCHALSRNEEPKILVDKYVELTYIDNLTQYVINKIINVTSEDRLINEYVRVPSDVAVKVTEVLSILMDIKVNYGAYSKNWDFADSLKKNLFVTFSSYLRRMPVS